ncbi:MAG: prolipoprotein diacylglyceryl transferase [Patescibacteria group bacterium]
MFNKISELTSTPKHLFYLFLGLGIAFTAIFSYPMSLVFQGKWELSQKIPLFDIPNYGPVDLRFYSICMLLGLISGYLLALKLAKIRGLADTVVDRLFVGLAFFGLVGARIFYVIFNWSDFFGEGDWTLAFQTYKGGLAIFGALLFGSIYMFWYCWRYKFNFWLFSDFVAPAVLLGQIIGRFGNFFNYESYGYPTKVLWKMYVPDSANVDFLSERYFHPTFLYEIIPNFILLLAILYFYDNLTKKHAGLVLALYLCGYGLIRFFVEIFRIDPLLLTFNGVPVFGDVPVRVSMAAAYLIFILGLCIWWVRRRVYVRYQTVTEIKLK